MQLILRTVTRQRTLYPVSRYPIRLLRCYSASKKENDPHDYLKKLQESEMNEDEQHDKQDEVSGKFWSGDVGKPDNNNNNNDGKKMLRSWIPIARRCYSSSTATPAYVIRRTANKGLPVYSDIKNGRTEKLTIVRRINGDANALREELFTLFPEASPAHIRVNPRNNQVIIKGIYVNEVKEWLIQKGF
ncbi:hypothetical protein EC973_000046 [Apophysomyces ossiformis]|uniref:Large ribosomal subunit protein mL49 n=1 Tax=Apophysomyces ossiformis TaxID=679940 RepID=A0A8H7ETU8_9FUNG|nr:hypothetical protein EC973_000046 [Apophysomyces ossiformis]